MNSHASIESVDSERVGRPTVKRYCSKCGKDVSHDLLRCSNCGNLIGDMAHLRSGMLLTASMLTLLAASISLLMGLDGFASLNAYIISDVYRGLMPPEYFELILLGLAGFALGLFSGLFSIDGHHFRIVLLGLAVMMASPVAIYVHTLQAPYPETPLLITMQLTLTIYGIPLIILSALASILMILRRREFQ